VWRLAGAIDAGGREDLAICYHYQRSETDVGIAIVAVLIAVVRVLQFVGDRMAKAVDHMRGHCCKALQLIR
jgi:D-methionine transport system permease protein